MLREALPAAPSTRRRPWLRSHPRRRIYKRLSSNKVFPSATPRAATADKGGGRRPRRHGSASRPAPGEGTANGEGGREEGGGGEGKGQRRDGTVPARLGRRHRAPCGHPASRVAPRRRGWKLRGPRESSVPRPRHQRRDRRVQTPTHSPPSAGGGAAVRGTALLTERCFTTARSPLSPRGERLRGGRPPPAAPPLRLPAAGPLPAGRGTVRRRYGGAGRGQSD